MKNTAHSILLVLFILFSTISMAKAPYEVNEVADGIFVHFGVHEDATAENIGAIANVGFIIGERCVAVIDSGGSFTEGQLLQQTIKQQTDKPVCYVINTHVHPDHILGNAAFKQNKPVYVGHKKLPAAMDARKDFFERAFSETLDKAYEGAEFISPGKTVTPDAPITVDLGHRALTLTAYPTAHTDHDLTVFDQQTQTLWTGDLLFIDRIPALDGSLLGWIKQMEQLSQLKANIVIPGHGPVQKGSSALQAWQAQLDYLTALRDQIRPIIENLGTIEEATAQVGLEQRDKWLLYEDYHKRNVTASFVELEWE